MLCLRLRLWFTNKRWRGQKVKEKFIWNRVVDVSWQIFLSEYWLLCSQIVRQSPTVFINLKSVNCRSDGRWKVTREKISVRLMEMILIFNNSK